MRIPTLLAGVVIGLLRSASAQVPPALGVASDLSIDISRYGFDSTAYVTLGPNGSLLLTGPFHYSLYVLDSTGTRVRTVGTQGDGPGQFIASPSAGWRGDSIWTYDNRLARLTLFDTRGSVARTMPVPRTVQGPPGVQPKAHNGLFGPSVIRYLPNGDLLILENIPALRSDVERTASVLLVSAPDGSYRSVAASVRSGLVFCEQSLSDGSWIPIPYCRPPYTAISANGRTVVNARGIMTGPDSGWFTVVRTDAMGDTAYACRFQTSMTPVTAPELDSGIAAVIDEERLPGRNRQIDSALRASPARLHQPLQALLVSDDGSVWVEMYGKGSERAWSVLDPSGDLIGQVKLPSDVMLKAVSGATLVGIRVLPKGATLVRYRVSGLPRH